MSEEECILLNSRILEIRNFMQRQAEELHDEYEVFLKQTDTKDSSLDVKDFESYETFFYENLYTIIRKELLELKSKMSDSLSKEIFSKLDEALGMIKRNVNTFDKYEDFKAYVEVLFINRLVSLVQQYNK